MPLDLVALSHKGFACSDAELLGHQIETGDSLGYGVLHLDAAVELEEEELAAVDDELDRARAPVADRPAEGDRRLEQGFSQLTGEPGSRGLFDHLLVAPLHRAVALAERHHVPVAIGEQLHLDVPRPFEIALAVESSVPERGLGLALGSRERLVELRSIADDAHPAAAAARRRLDHERKADLGRSALRKRGNACLASDPLRGELVSSEAQRFRWRTDPGQPRSFYGLREVGVFGEEPVAGVNGVRTDLLGGSNVLLRVEVARDLDDLVRRARVQRSGVIRGGDGDGRHPALSACAKDAHCDLAAVRDQHLLDRHGAQLTEASYSRGVIRLLVRTAIALVANAVGLIVAATLLDGMSLDVTGFVTAVVVYTVVFALMQPFLFSTFRRAAAPVLGGVALIATLVSLIVATLVTDGLSISGIGTWIAATVVVWLASILAGFILPFLGLKKYLDERRD